VAVRASRVRLVFRGGRVRAMPSPRCRGRWCDATFVRPFQLLGARSGWSVLIVAALFSVFHETSSGTSRSLPSPGVWFSDTCASARGVSYPPSGMVYHRLSLGRFSVDKPVAGGLSSAVNCNADDSL
jgi:hypothetical protein